MASGDTKTQQYLGIAANGTRTDIQRGCCDTRTQTLIMDVAERIITEEENREAADNAIQDEIDEIRNNPDVVDIVGTYADLEDYDTSTLTDNDIVRVLEDETHDGNSTYYRYSKTNDSWAYIGESKQYDDFVGTDGTNAGEAGLVPAPTTADAGKFLKADGTWDTAGSAVNVVQTTGISTTDVMSQNAVTSMVYGSPSNKRQIRIGNNAAAGNIGVAIGEYSAASSNGVALGNRAEARGDQTVSIGNGAQTSYIGSIALGSGARPSAQGEMQIGIAPGLAQENTGYNNSNYRLISGVYDGQGDHDAATVGQIIPNDVVAKFWTGTQAEYDAIATKDAKTLYLIEESEVMQGELSQSAPSLQTLSTPKTMSREIEAEIDPDEELEPAEEPAEEPTESEE